MQQPPHLNGERLLDHAVLGWLHGHWVLVIIVALIAVIEEASKPGRRRRQRYR